MNPETLRAIAPQARYILPSFIEHSSFGVKESNPYNKLFEERIIFLGTQVDDEIANRLCAQMLLLAAEYLGVVLWFMMAVEMTVMALFMVMFMMNPAGLNPMNMVHQPRLALGAGLAIFLLLGSVALFADFPERPAPADLEPVRSLGREMLGPSMLVFESAGLVLLGISALHTQALWPLLVPLFVCIASLGCIIPNASACAMSSLAVARVCSESPPPPEPTPMIRFSSSNLRSGSEFSKKSIIS